MNEQRNNGKGIFYGVIGVATLVVAIIGATFAYFTASASNNNVITGNMATVSLDLAVRKVTTVDELKGGMIPMSNTMVEVAINKETNDVCVDDNGNAVCQIYEITLSNDSSAGQFVDGYVSLKYGAGAPTDFTESWTEYKDEALFDNATKALATADANGVGTTMRWAQVFKGLGSTVTNNATTSDYSTAGEQKLGVGENEKEVFTHIGQDEDQDNTGKNTDNILTAFSGDLKGSTTISGNSYDTIGKNYIRVSDHAWATSGDESYDRNNDITSALVFNHNIAAYSEATYYIVVWLSETGTNQTAGTGTNVDADGLSFFSGNVTFVSAQGSEVSATFSSYSRVPSQPGA